MVEYFQLAHNVRHAETGRPVAQIIHNFGRVDELDRDALVRLRRSIARVCGLDVQDPIERTDKSAKRQEPTALPEGVGLIRTLELGTVLTIEALWERLGIGPILRKAMEESGAGLVFERALLAMTANRLCEPESKLGIWDRWLSKVYMPSRAGIRLGQMVEVHHHFPT